MVIALSEPECICKRLSQLQAFANSNVAGLAPSVVHCFIRTSTVCKECMLQGVKHCLFFYTLM